jgi:G3E family GTPase
MLSESQNERIAVILNAPSALDVDHRTVSHATELIELNGGNLCCTARDNLVAAIRRVLRSSHALDRIVIETSGLADPAATIRTLVLDDELRNRTRLDAIVTVVDLKHIIAHWIAREACAQIVFSDVIVLNKTDLVSEAELFAVRDRIRRLNLFTRMFATERCELPIEQVRDVSAFNLSRAIAIDPQLLDDTTHEHDPDIASICVAREGVIDAPRVVRVLTALALASGADLHRVKGIMNVHDERRRIVLNGVHSWLEARPGAPWLPQESRTNQLVLIGRTLDRQALEQSLSACFVSVPAAISPLA